jgi:mannose-6-phosphate isomerase-like protein (cupin superfamily)
MTKITDWTEERPWGHFKNLLDTEFTKVKIIEVLPGKRLSYQSHTKRQESWTITLGEAIVTLDGKDHVLGVGDQITIPIGSKHRIENKSSTSLTFVEVQTGSYFGEDDIKRYEDDFGRV